MYVWFQYSGPSPIWIALIRTHANPNGLWQTYSLVPRLKGKSGNKVANVLKVHTYRICGGLSNCSQTEETIKQKPSAHDMRKEIIHVTGILYIERYAYMCMH